jgi:tetratricopeptide (TPR) repeat protein
MPFLIILRPYLQKLLLVALALLIAYLWSSVRYQLAHMGSEFFQDSWAGKQALGLYLLGDYNGAARAYRAHFADLPPLNKRENESGQDAILRGDLKTAKAKASEALAQNPGNEEALLDLAEVALLEGDARHAREYTEQILRKDADHADALLLASLSAARSQNADRALDTLNRLLRQSRIGSRLSSFFALLETTGDLADLPLDERPYNVLALYARYLRIFDPSNGPLAIRYAEKAIGHGDRPEDAYLTIGIVYDKAGRKQAAIEAFQKAIEANPKYPLGYWWAADAYGKVGDLSNEYLMSKAAVTQAPGDPFYGELFTYVLMEKLGDFHQAVAYLRTAVLTSPDSEGTRERLAYSLDFIGNYDEAAAQYREAIRMNPGKPEFYESLADTIYRTGRFEEAVSVLQQAAKNFPARAKPHIRLGDLYLDRFRGAEAVREYEEAGRLGSWSARVCKAYQQAEKLEESVKCFQNILKVNPTDQYANRNLPEILAAINYKRSKR